MDKSKITMMIIQKHFLNSILSKKSKDEVITHVLVEDVECIEFISEVYEISIYNYCLTQTILCILI